MSIGPMGTGTQIFINSQTSGAKGFVLKDLPDCEPKNVEGCQKLTFRSRTLDCISGIIFKNVVFHCGSVVYIQFDNGADFLEEDE
jgi:hypothetical protein